MIENYDQAAVPTEGESTEYVGIKVMGHDGSMVMFKVKKNKPLEKMMKVYCERMNLDPPAVRFLFDGQRVQRSDTPNSIDLQEGGELEVKVTVNGGGVVPEVKEEEDNNEFIVIKVISQGTSEIQFKIKKEAPFEKLMKMYCEEMGLDPGTVRFLFDTDRVQKSDSPASMGMKEGDQLDVAFKMDGGGPKKAESTHKKILIKLIGTNKSVIHFKVSRDKPFSKLMKIYCETAKISDPSTVRYFHDYEQVEPRDTPRSLQMEDSAELKVQVGGADQECCCDGDSKDAPGCPLHTPKGSLPTLSEKYAEVEPAALQSAQEVKEAERKLISIKVIGHDKSVLQYKVSKDKPLANMMTSYYEKMNLDPSTVRFHFHEQRAMRYHSPDQLEMDDGDVLDVYIYADGGCKAPLGCAADKMEASPSWIESGHSNSEVSGGSGVETQIRL